jgi:C1A family cysteine protease
LPSRLFLYWNSRKITGDERVDDGTYLRTCIAGLVKFGAPPEEAWPFAPIRINRMPSATAYHASYDRRGPAGYYRAAEGEPRIEQVRGAIASGYPVVFGTRIDASFNRVANADTIGPPTGEIIGGHAMCIVGYDGRGVRVANSWGSEWGDTGLYWMSYDWLASDHVHDVWAVVP